MRRRRWLTITSLSLCAARVHADSVKIDFEDLRFHDAVEHDLSPTYRSLGYTFVATPPSPNNAERFDVFGDQSQFFVGSTAIFNGQSNGKIDLTRDDGAAFNLESIDLAQLSGGDQFGRPLDAGPVHLTFTGVEVDGSLITNNVEVSAFLTEQTVNFNGFRGLREVYWFQGSGDTGDTTHVFDNVVLSTATAAEAPLPTPAMTIGALLAAVMIGARRRWAGLASMFAFGGGAKRGA